MKDRVDKKELNTSYCPTEAMLADFFAKPLQGSLFRLFRSVIMGHEDIEVLFKLDRIKGRVEKQLILPNMNQESKKVRKSIQDDKQVQSEEKVEHRIV